MREVGGELVGVRDAIGSVESRVTAGVDTIFDELCACLEALIRTLQLLQSRSDGLASVSEVVLPRRYMEANISSTSSASHILLPDRQIPPLRPSMKR